LYLNIFILICKNFLYPYIIVNVMAFIVKIAVIATAILIVIVTVTTIAYNRKY